MNLKLFLGTWLAGLPGVAAFAWLVLPILVADRPLPLPLWVVQLASASQSAALLAVAAFLGATLAHKVNLSTPTLIAFLEAKSISKSLRQQLIPGIIGGIIGAAILWLFTRFAPDVLAQAQAKFSMPALVRLLYGGITEEILIRWGFMTLFVWLFWRFIQKGKGSPSAVIMYAAIVISALFFGIGHLPAVSAMMGSISPCVAVYIVTANAAFGLVAGWLFWRFGLESAILAHVLAHATTLLLPW